MNSTFRKALCLVVALVVVVVVVQPFWGNASAHSNGKNSLVGTWRVKVTPKNCQTGAPGPGFDVLLSFKRSGTVTEMNSSPAFLAGQRAPGLGAWSHIHGNSYKAVVDAFILVDSPIFKRGVQRLAWDLNVDGDDATIEATSQFLDSNGNLVAATCASATATRMEASQDED